MNKDKLRRHIRSFLKRLRDKKQKSQQEYQERKSISERYGGWTKDELKSFTEEDLYDYLAPLWAMRIWGNKHYVIDKIIEDNGLEHILSMIAELLHGPGGIESRWDSFRSDIKGMGPAMMSELLCRTHPSEYMIWNRKARIGLRYLEVEELPRYDYQLTGEVYSDICDKGKEIAAELRAAGMEDNTLLAVDYFVWDELQISDEDKTLPPPPPNDVFIHNDVRDKIRDIGQWLGFEANIERRVSEGSKVDAVWESTIGNMGRVIYVFEVQTKGSIDSLIINLLKSLNNPAVQGVVAVSERKQLEKIARHAEGVIALKKHLRYWDYKEVLNVHESLEFVNSSINELGLVPQGF